MWRSSLRVRVHRLLLGGAGCLLLAMLVEQLMDVLSPREAAVSATDVRRTSLVGTFAVVLALFLNLLIRRSDTGNSRRTAPPHDPHITPKNGSRNNEHDT